MKPAPLLTVFSLPGPNVIKRALLVMGAVRLGVRRRKFRASEQVSQVTRRRVQWDFIHARVVF